MIPALLYLYPLDDPATFDPCAQRWANTYRSFPPGYAHNLNICFCNGVITDRHRNVFHGIQYREHLFMGKGWDIGTYQHMAGILDDEFVVFMNARVHFRKPGWLKRLMEVRLKLGDGLYAMSTSNEMTYPVSDVVRTKPNPHVRTACFGYNPKRFRRYPYLIDSRDKGFYFESGMWNFMRWNEDMGYMVKMVLWDGVYDKKDWRKPENIFRRGNQSNLLVCDRHTEMFARGDAQLRRNLARTADLGE